MQPTYGGSLVWRSRKNPDSIALCPVLSFPLTCHRGSVPFQSMLQEFKDFILKGNAIDLAVGVLIGAAFGGLVKAITDGLIHPIISWLGGDVKVSWQVGIFDLGLVVNSAFSLLITGLVLFFIFVKPMNKLRSLTSRPAAPAPAPEPSNEEKLLAEIRDLLKNRPSA